MTDNRRDFIRKSVGYAAAISAGNSGRGRGDHGHDGGAPDAGGRKPTPMDIRIQKEVVRDAGMQMSEAYFDGFNQHKIALCRQMDVLGAVAGINPKMVGLDGKPWEIGAVQAVKNAWDNEGLKMTVIEGPPSLGEKTKLGLEGRDEEIANFITFMHNLQKVGIDTICYNWMPVIGWYRTDNAKRGRGGALVTAFDNEEIGRAHV